MVLQSQPDIEIISIHIPKTAGTTFKKILLEVYQLDNVLFDYPKAPLSKEEILTLPSKTRIIHGHFPVIKYDNLFPQAKRIVWLRDPIERLISLYIYTAILRLDRQIQDFQQEKELLLKFASKKSNQDEISYYLEGMLLEDFFFIGLQNFFFTDLQILKEKLDWKKINIGYYNKSPYSNYNDFKNLVLSDKELLNELKFLNSKDIEIYQQALELRERNMKNNIQLFTSVIERLRQENKILNQKNRQLQKKIKQATNLSSGNLIKNEKVIEYQKFNLRNFTIIVKQNQIIKENVNNLCKFSFDLPKISNHSLNFSGWVIGINSCVVNVELFTDQEQLIQKVTPNIKRPIIAKRFISLPGSQFSGFAFKINLDNNIKYLQLKVTLQDNTKIDLATIEILPVEFFLPIKKTFFIHIGKTAGSSFNKFLQSNLVGEAHCERYRQLDQPFLLNQLEKLKSFDFISGHLQLSHFNQNFNRDEYFLVTILREPLTQTISHINWIAHIHNSDHNSPFYINHPQAVKEMALDLCSRNLNDTAQVIDFLEKYSMFKNFQSRSFQTNYNAELNSKQIIENILSFDLVGFTENYNLFIDKYINLIGGQGKISPSLDKVNVNNKPALDAKKLMNNQLFVDFIKEYSAIDIEVYNYFKKA